MRQERMEHDGLFSFRPGHSRLANRVLGQILRLLLLLVGQPRQLAELTEPFAAVVALQFSLAML
jgi:hypothetical protein